MSPQRILHVIGKMDRAGAETMLMNLYRHIDRELIQFDFITFVDQKADYEDEILSMGGKIFPIIANNPLKRMRLLKQFLKNHPEYQTVHAHTLLSNAFHLLAAKQAGVNQLISHSHNTSNGKQTPLKSLYEKWALLVIRKIATHRLACGKEAAKFMFGSDNKVIQISNSVDVKTMLETANHSKDYLQQHIDNEESQTTLRIIQVGRFNEVKNHTFSLEIAKELQQLNVKFRLYLAGQGPLEEDLKARVDKAHLKNQVSFLGVRSDITELMASADIMIMPSLHEGFPVVLVESQAVGLSSLISDQISKEVDLGLGLVKFLPLLSANEWAEQIINHTPNRPTNQDIRSSLETQGFDAKANSKYLSEIYLNP